MLWIDVCSSLKSVYTHTNMHTFKYIYMHIFLYTTQYTTVKSSLLRLQIKKQQCRLPNNSLLTTPPYLTIKWSVLVEKRSACHKPATNQLDIQFKATKSCKTLTSLGSFFEEQEVQENAFKQINLFLHAHILIPMIFPR